jgi:DNA (cytosine-5)-methyltransferase 1
MMLRLGSLCTGYGGLDLAAETVLGPLHHTWHAENEPGPAAVLAHHWPTTPNLGDLTTVDWTTVPAVDVLTAGYPCQGESVAGKRLGAADKRWIWRDVYAAIRHLRPRLVLLENVAGHLSLGFGRVVGDLAAAGFDAEWGCFRASDVGAPHRRERVFIVAWPADAACSGLEVGREGRPGGAPAGPGGGVMLLPTPTAKCSEDSQTHRSGARSGELLLTGVAKAWAVGALLPTPCATDGTKGGPNQRRGSGAQGGPMLAEAVQPGRWGAYASAVARWELATGRPAPDPTELGTKGQPRLAPRFVEWLMGLPAGWVTDHLPRNPALKCLGNGVVWQQAAHAYTALLAAVARHGAAANAVRVEVPV